MIGMIIIAVSFFSGLFAGRFLYSILCVLAGLLLKIVGLDFSNSNRFTFGTLIFPMYGVVSAAFLFAWLSYMIIAIIVGESGWVASISAGAFTIASTCIPDTQTKTGNIRQDLISPYLLNIGLYTAIIASIVLSISYIWFSAHFSISLVVVFLIMCPIVLITCNGIKKIGEMM